MIARVVRGFPADAPRIAAHTAVRVDLPEGPFLVDVGFGNLTPTEPLVLQPNVVQVTPHEPMRFLPISTELVLQVKLGEAWENLYRICSHTCLDIDYEVANCFTATHPNSVFVNNLIAARPSPDGLRHTFLNWRLSVRQSDGRVERRMLGDDAEIATELAGTFGLPLSADVIGSALAVLTRKGTRAAEHSSLLDPTATKELCC
jgi:N-hydroxyarylamine O-acetyltransferase